MPGLYSDTNLWNVAWLEDGGFYDNVKFTASYPCPLSESSSRRTSGYAGGPTIEAATTEYRAWMAIAAYDGDRRTMESYGKTLALYNTRTLEIQHIDPLPPLTADEIARSKHMMTVKLARESGKLYLTIDASALHETLDAIGCQTEVAGSVIRYKDRPHTTVSAIDTNSHSISTELLLTKGPQKVDLSTVYTRPPSTENLKKLANSSYEKCRTILDHYQPIDIQVTIQKKVLAS